MATSITCTTATCITRMAPRSRNTPWQLAAQTPPLARLATTAAVTRKPTGTALAAATLRFLTVTTSITWLKGTCTIRTATIATTTARCDWRDANPRRRARGFEAGATLPKCASDPDLRRKRARASAAGPGSAVYPKSIRGVHLHSLSPRPLQTVTPGLCRSLSCGRGAACLLAYSSVPGAPVAAQLPELWPRPRLLCWAHFLFAPAHPRWLY
jgi:hypothetical protein